MAPEQRDLPHGILLPQISRISSGPDANNNAGIPSAARALNIYRPTNQTTIPSGLYLRPPSTLMSHFAVSGPGSNALHPKAEFPG